MHPLLCEHPLGDLRSPICPHWIPEHPEGHQQPVPCIHAKRVQTGGHWEGPLWVPEFRVEYEHQNDGFIHIPCTDLHQAHASGNCDFGPCWHRLDPVRRDAGRNVTYYTDNSEIQTAVETAYDRLTALGVRDIGLPQRPLLIFNHGPAIDGSQSDPMWSHYDPMLHAIQILSGHSASTVFHEMGHAIVGQNPVQVMSPGGPHDVDQPTLPGLALQEGWADFVSCAIRFAPNDKNATYSGHILEGIPTEQGRRDVELDVARCLWDFYDSGGTRSRRDPLTGRWIIVQIPDDEVCRLTFGQLFGVFSPTLATLSAGPGIRDIDDYVNRLIANNQGQRAAINSAFARNFN